MPESGLPAAQACVKARRHVRLCDMGHRPALRKAQSPAALSATSSRPNAKRGHASQGEEAYLRACVLPHVCAYIVMAAKRTAALLIPDFSESHMRKGRDQSAPRSSVLGIPWVLSASYLAFLPVADRVSRHVSSCSFPVFSRNAPHQPACLCVSLQRHHLQPAPRSV